MVQTTEWNFVHCEGGEGGDSSRPPAIHGLIPLDFSIASRSEERGSTSDHGYSRCMRISSIYCLFEGSDDLDAMTARTEREARGVSLTQGAG